MWETIKTALIWAAEAFERTDRFLIVVVSFSVGALLAWFAAREWYLIEALTKETEEEA